MKVPTKCPRACMSNVKVDWISRLPDELLILVLSFLTTKEAVQTCILSKRWRRVWVNLPILKFNVNEFVVDDSIGVSDEALRKSFARFEQFVSGVLENIESTHLNRVLYVHDTKPAHSYSVPMRWLDRVAFLMPQLIDIYIARVKSLEFPDSLFSRATLQHLEIKLFDIEKTTVIPESINLPSLKVFDVTDAELHENFPQNLLTGCPFLEILNLSFCGLHFSTISSNKLKELHIAGCRQYVPIQISCPRLLSLRICSDLQYGDVSISLRNMKLLKRAILQLNNMAQHFDGGDVPVLNFLGGLSNATQLILCIGSSDFNIRFES